MQVFKRILHLTSKWERGLIFFSGNVKRAIFFREIAIIVQWLKDSPSAPHGLGLLLDGDPCDASVVAYFSEQKNKALGSNPLSLHGFALGFPRVRLKAWTS